MLDRVVGVMYTTLEFLERPLARDHRTVHLFLLLLADSEVHQRTAIRGFPQLEILSVTIALIDAIDEYCANACLSSGAFERYT